jgi:ABC-2 type transport system permease protein
MSAVLTIARRDLRSYLTSPIAYIVIGTFVLIMGWTFFNVVGFYATGQMKQMGSPGLTETVIAPIYQNMNVIFLFFMPFLSMRAIAEERKLQTLQLLMTSPVTLTQIVFGKFFGLFSILFLSVLITFAYPLILMIYGNPDMGPILTNILGVLLMGSCYLAVGLFFSSTTENQIVAGSLTFGFSIFMWLIQWAAYNSTGATAEIFNNLSLMYHYTNFGRGTLALGDSLFYLSFIGFFLFLTQRVLDSYRWR